MEVVGINLTSDTAFEAKPIASPSITLVHSHAPHFKRALRIFRDLKHDHALAHPEVRSPSAWLMRCLLVSHLRGEFEEDWRASVVRTLSHIAHTSAPKNRSRYRFFEQDGRTPLYPTAEGFDLNDTYVFAHSLLCFFKAQSPTHLI